MIRPRHSWYPAAARSLGVEACAWWRAAGGTLFDWQEFVIEGILGLDERDRWVTTDDGLEVARQNGKGVVLMVVEGFVAFELGAARGYRVVTHTAHEFATALEHQLRLEEVIQNAPHLHAKVRDIGGYRHANGQESIRLKDGTRIIFKARTRGGGRGFSGDLLVWDEAMELPDSVIGAQKPTLRASKGCHGPKTIYAGSAVDQAVHLNGVAFTRIRERGIQNAPRVSWAEWSAPFEHPDLLTVEDMLDESNMRAANPSIDDGLISVEGMADEISTMPRRVAAVEYYGVGDRPRTDEGGDGPIALEAWDSLEFLDSKLQPPYAICFDVSPDRWTAISLAGRNQRERFHVELQEFKSGTAWVPQWLARAYERNGADIYSIVCDGVGPAASLLVELEELGVPVDTFTSAEHAEACGRFLDMVAERELEHLGSPELRDAIAGAATRPLNDRWAWNRKSSRVNIAPLVSATLALGAAAGISVGEVMIY